MDLSLLTETIIKLIVDDEEAVSVREYETIEEDIYHLEVMVAKEDLARVIGKDGRTIRSIRDIVQASSTLNGGKKIQIDVDSY
jgi:hypothetical protein